AARPQHIVVTPAKGIPHLDLFSILMIGGYGDQRGRNDWRIDWAVSANVRKMAVPEAALIPTGGDS
ncbi:MAG: hypothetical protein WCJ35_21015, partial [Planctomycetota bacterium]